MASSSSANYDAHRFRSPFHQNLFEEHVASKCVTPEIGFDLQQDQYLEIKEQIARRGWKRLSNPRTKIINLLIQEFYANAARTKEEIADAEAHPYKSYVRGVQIDFSADNIKQILRIRDNTLGAELDFDTSQRRDQRLDKVIEEICVPGAKWKMSSSQPNQPIQLKRQDLTPLARGWHEFIIHSIIPIGNKSEITVARAILIHSIIKGDDVRAEELIADNIVMTTEGVQGRSKLIFPSTIYRLCKEPEVSLRGFRGSELIPVDKPITARIMVRTRGRHINYHQNPQVEEEEEQIPQNENGAENENQQEEEQSTMHFEATNAGFQNNFGEQQHQVFQQLNEELSNLRIQQQQFFENMQNTQAQYLKELEALKTRDPIEKMEERIHQQHNEIIEMRSQIKEWTKNASSRKAYYCWAHQQANPNLVQIPIHDIPKFVHDNAAKGRHIFQGALKTQEQGEPSQFANIPMAEPGKE
ncbi:hypothetical protein PIB30_046268 [Stylosanthes scabra]|uniref:Putative plant transposon protein domain-containing protein n=1 Tax=Stylosanthes scabra TaxID=79078 RepID=A0ABU6YIS1_9FABA|nr:hypothetical protein [Stylosanthes scabra]